MLRLRPYEPRDAAIILSWIPDEFALRQWSADRYGPYPVTAEEMNRQYAEMGEEVFPLTAVEDGKTAGHLILRFTDRQTVRLGFVIVDTARRGRGLGREMVRLALARAFDGLNARRATLGVFENNPAAAACYASAGFRETPLPVPVAYPIMGESWACREMAITRDQWRGMNRRGTEKGVKSCGY
ncbi:MAG: GNAT family N-acetyltransferase [Clostridia bacterium]|nr:GNAT family N-acetyltransferase [Clostridia bacterium]